jgi:hypothetical protein
VVHHHHQPSLFGRPKVYRPYRRPVRTVYAPPMQTYVPPVQHVVHHGPPPVQMQTPLANCQQQIVPLDSRKSFVICGDTLWAQKNSHITTGHASMTWNQLYSRPRGLWDNSGGRVTRHNAGPGKTFLIRRGGTFSPHSVIAESGGPGIAPIKGGRWTWDELWR